MNPVHVVAGKPSIAVGYSEIRWAPVSQSVRVSFAGTDYQTVCSALQNTFSRFPIRLSKDHMQILKAMGHAAGQGGTPYNKIADALEKFGELELTQA